MFEAIDHVDPNFDPKLTMNSDMKMGIGPLLYGIYESAGNNEKVKQIAEREISFLYIAEKRPDYFNQIFHITLRDGREPMDFVYGIVGEDSWKKLRQ